MVLSLSTGSFQSISIISLARSIRFLIVLKGRDPLYFFVDSLSSCNYLEVFEEIISKQFRNRYSHIPLLPVHREWATISIYNNTKPPYHLIDMTVSDPYYSPASIGV